MKSSKGSSANGSYADGVEPSTPVDLDSFLARLARLGDDFAVHGGPPASRRAITAAENKLGTALSAEHRTIVERFGALAIVAKEEVWRRPVEHEVCPVWRFAWAIEVLGVVPRGHPESVDIVVQARARPPGGRRRLVPALHVAGRLYGYDRRGTMFSWSRREPPEPFEAERFFPALAVLVDRLVANTERAKEEAGSAPPHDEVVPSTEEAAGRIMTGLVSADCEERQIAAGDARELDPIPPGVAKALVRALADDDRDVRIAAAESLELAASPLAVDALLALLPRAKENPRWAHQAEVGAILRALATSAPSDPRVVDAIVPYLVVADRPHASLAAHEALRSMGRAAKAALPALRARLEDAHLWTRAQTRATLTAVEGKPKVHVAALFDLLALDRGRPSAGVEQVLEDVVVALGRRSAPLLREAATRTSVGRVAKRLLREHGNGR